ncbi:M14 family metallopeptidase [Tuwongella immobilis]|uniref:Succinylglutamate desuccinylase/Aspartoacylase catalytic domain-containing protein n=1 Tax=Tuwongella immobilis TaxID=692036 RepID=A0A6C2YLB7_9BACT|nr:succinylglutamate desuccinylase/aspartoacylase family protein [Tuwongella immobilis]VIP01712.1 deacylase : Putative deacylase OS=Singulisphaera acidiphila (strain ATCC BAA-1392 / DSM 18658 / VKM B-2454 / MOB10) GN=Sinac_6138 PE=4 SV=1: AstE_AspA [Tuwongella immobilis]VTR99224.1 deacylase : Putative deacylase OS=Singulisphaera acidiphila (strain ATCC BAA-1392 / DSM 18658 / VKM B-2454 / MOB10) GN=Sinac_6138 PE=4 SV=1: AstE_AspA [Tuwongella immobilis]
MTRTIVRPERLDLDSPGRRDYWVALEHDSIWGDHLIPLTVIVGPHAKDGEGLVSFGSNHGNEYEGPMALKHLLREIRTEDVLGRMILVPVLNPGAFRAGTREATLDDRVNLNRAFVPGAGVTPSLAGITHRIAGFVRSHIWPRVHVVLDLHSGGDVARFALCANFHPVDDPELSRKIEDTARWFGTPFLMVYQNQTPGLLPSEAERLGKITVGTELGWGSAVCTDGVKYGRQGVLAAAINHGQLRGQIERIDFHKSGNQKKVEMVDRECFTVAPFDGHYEPIVDCGNFVKAGTTVGYLHDFDYIDAEPYPAVAGVDGYVLAQTWRAPVMRGQHIVVVARDIG